MLIPSENKTYFSVRFQTTVDGACKTRIEILDRLASAVERLGRAKLSLETDAPKVSGCERESLRNHLDELRLECGSIRGELEYHRVIHGC